MPERHSEVSPLPVSQIAILMVVRLAEPVSYTVIFPFVNQMIEELGITDNPDRVGIYSGLVESVFAFVQFFTVYHWAKLSDKVGRKPVILVGLAGIALSGSLFGLATSFWMMILFRSLCGALNGNVAVVKAAIGDITDDSNSTEAFAMYGLIWAIGSMIGTAIGGSLSHPYEQFPGLFGSAEFLRIHPFLLPCLVGAGMTAVGMMFTLLFFHESLPGLSIPRPSHVFPLRINTGLSRLSLSFPSPFNKTAMHKKNSSMASLVSDTETLVGFEGAQEELLGKRPSMGSLDGKRTSGEWTFLELMGFKKVRVMTATVFLNSFVGGAWNSAVLLFFFDKNNGLGMPPSAIGSSMALSGIWTILCQILLLTRIQRWFGVAMGYKLLSLGWPISWLLMPMLRQVLVATETPLPPPDDMNMVNHGYHPILYADTRAWSTTICVYLYLMFNTILAMTSSLLMVLVNSSSPDKSALGAINGIGTAAGCMARVMGPSLVSALFAISMDGQVMGGKLWWIFMVGMSMINFGVCCLLEPESSSMNHSCTEDREDELEMGVL